MTVSASQRLAPGLEHCALEVEMGGQKFLDGLFRGETGQRRRHGRRLLAADVSRDLAAQEVERIARSLVITKKIIEEK